jgi:large conductance mechanosensitive channel
MYRYGTVPPDEAVIVILRALCSSGPVTSHFFPHFLGATGMSLLQEFKKFALKGNVIDMAVGIVIGASFTKIVNSLVTDIITPIIGKITAGEDFSNLFIWLGTGTRPATYALTKGENGGPAIGYGSFIQATIDFLIVAAAMFAVIKLMNRAQELFDRKKEAEPPPAPPEDVQLLREIRDALVAGR